MAVVTDRTLRSEPVWGTQITLDVRDPVSDETVDAVFAWFARVDDLFSTWREDTEISRLGRGEIGLRDVSHEVRDVLELCDRVQAESRGAFDVRVGSDPRVTPREGLGRIDPSGLVKGWALDRAAEALRDAGCAHFSIQAGGDVITAGGPWRVGIQHPWERDKVAAVLSVTDLAVATSGRYERGDHIIDPRSGLPATGLMSVSVVTAELAIADGYATAALVLGVEGLEWLSGLSGVSAMAITDEREVLVTASFDEHRVVGGAV
ncbi:MAG: FAD:protein transferase [Actinomycetota bacterium]|nr:FAD:protein transferase [Actinomycetota bacterium]